MPERETDRRRREREHAEDALPERREAHPILALQRAAGNHAVAQMLSRAPAAGGGNTAQIHGVGEIKVHGGNLDELTAGDVPPTLDVTSHKGKHSAKLEHLSHAKTKTEVKVTIAAANHAGEQLNVGGGTVLEIKDARVADYAVEGGVETWRLTDFTNVHRTKIVHHVG